MKMVFVLIVMAMAHFESNDRPPNFNGSGLEFASMAECVKAAELVENAAIRFSPPGKYFRGSPPRVVAVCVTKGIPQ